MNCELCDDEPVYSISANKEGEWKATGVCNESGPFYYVIDISRLKGKGFKSCLKHLRTKPWFDEKKFLLKLKQIRGY